MRGVANYIDVISSYHVLQVVNNISILREGPPAGLNVRFAHSLN